MLALRMIIFSPLKQGLFDVEATRIRAKLLQSVVIYCFLTPPIVSCVSKYINRRTQYHIRSRILKRECLIHAAVAAPAIEGVLEL
jgi:hypothetical protein